MVLMLLYCGTRCVHEQIMDLENRNAVLQEELSLSPAKRAALQTDWVPRAPASYVLKGHRSTVLKVAFHPTFNVLASASEDATIKIWDWETGEFERTLKGHTRAVNDVAFDSKGNLLGALPDSLQAHTLGVVNANNSRSVMLVRSIHQSLGRAERVEEHEDIPWSRAHSVLRAILAR